MFWLAAGDGHRRPLPANAGTDPALRDTVTHRAAFLADTSRSPVGHTVRVDLVERALHLWTEPIPAGDAGQATFRARCTPTRCPSTAR